MQVYVLLFILMFGSMATAEVIAALPSTPSTSSQGNETAVPAAAPAGNKVEPSIPAPAAKATGSVFGKEALTAPKEDLKPVVLSFVEWKALRVHEAQQKLERGAKRSDFAAAETPEENQKLNFNVDVALQLNVQDYFSMYLKSLSLAEFQEASKKLTSEEVTELLLAYKASLEASKAPTLKFSKSEK